MPSLSGKPSSSQCDPRRGDFTGAVFSWIESDTGAGAFQRPLRRIIRSRFKDSPIYPSQRYITAVTPFKPGQGGGAFKCSKNCRKFTHCLGAGEPVRQRSYKRIFQVLDTKTCKSSILNTNKQQKKCITIQAIALTKGGIKMYNISIHMISTTLHCFLTEPVLK